LPQRPVSFSLDEARLIEVKGSGKLSRRLIGQLRPAAFVLMHDELGVARPALRYSRRQDLAGMSVTQDDAHASHTRADEFGVLGKHTEDYLRLLGRGDGRDHEAR
jgi:hypothetical protein